jgi:hypothetical protein
MLAWAMPSVSRLDVKHQKLKKSTEYLAVRDKMFIFAGKI